MPQGWMLWVGGLVLGVMLLTIGFTVAWRHLAPSIPPEQAAQYRVAGEHLVQRTLAAQASAGPRAPQPVRVLVMAAHPDDVEYWVGGTLARLIKEGVHVTIVLATRGELGGKGDPQALARRREAEQRAAAAILGIQAVHFLNWPDRDVKAGPLLEAEVLQLLETVQPNLFFTFDAKRPMFPYIHPDHQAVGRSAVRAFTTWEAGGGQGTLCLFHTRRPNVLVEITDFVDLKRKAYAAHASQLLPKDGLTGFAIRALNRLTHQRLERKAPEPQTHLPAFRAEEAFFCSTLTPGDGQLESKP